MQPEANVPTAQEERQAADVRTFLIADVRGYTRYVLEHGDAAGAEFADRFVTIARQVVGETGGDLLEVRGDEVLSVFSSTRQALLASVELQERYAAESDAGEETAFRVGIGLDAGEAIPISGGYRGAALNLAARLCSLAGPGEILASDAVVHLARKVEGISYFERGFAQLKGFSEPVRVIEVGRSDPLERAVEVAAREQRLPIGGFLGSLPSGLLVGRDEELAQITQRVEAVGGGTGQLVLLAGEPGVGKTRLAQEVTLQLRNRAFLLAAGRCYEPQQSVAFYPFLEALAQLFDVAPATVKAEAVKHWPYLGQLLPDQIPMHAVAAENADDQQRLFRAVTGFLQAIAEEVPVAVLLDDLHWSDPSSLELLHHLARQTRADRVLLFGTYRDVEVDRQHPLEATLRDLTREALLTRIEVTRLEQDDTAHLIGEVMGEERISPELAGLIQRRTDGNPFFVQQVMRVLVERGDIYREGGRWQRKEIEEIEVPESVRSVIGQRLSRLSEETQATLREASVLGQTFNFDELLAASQRDEAELETSLEEASRAGLVRPVERDNYAFDHALTQQALYAELSPRRRRKLHLAAGEALDQLPEMHKLKRAGELAWHFLQADDPSRAIEWAVKAGDQAERVFAHTEAELQYRTAVELAEDTEDAGAQAEALQKLGRVLHIAGRNEEALEVLEGAAHYFRVTGQRGREVAAVSLLADTHAFRGTPEEGIKRLSSLLEEAGEYPHVFSDRDLAALYGSLAGLYFSGGRYSELVQTAQRAVDLSRSAGDRQLLAFALSRLGVGLLNANRWEEATTALDECMAVAEAIGDLRSASRAASNRGVIAFFREGDLEKHLECRIRALELARRGGDAGPTVFGEAMVCMALFELGRWDEALAHGRTGVELARSIGPGWNSAYALRMLGNVLMWQGVDGGRDLLMEGLDQARQIGDLQGIATGTHFLADFDMIAGRAEEVLEAWPAVLENPELGATIFGVDTASLAWAYLESGDEESAERTLEQGREHAERGSLGPFVADIKLVTAMLARRRAQWDLAKSELDEGLELVRLLQSPLRVARLLDEYGRLLKAKGEFDQARERFNESLDISRRLGAKPMIEYTEKALAALAP